LKREPSAPQIGEELKEATDKAERQGRWKEAIAWKT
jgi:hypothetical protein